MDSPPGVPPDDPGRQTLLEGEARLRAILDSAVDAIIAMDERGIIQSFNAAAERLFGYTEQEVFGRNVSLLMPSPYREEHDGYVATYRSTGRARIIGTGREVEARRKDGEVFPIHLSVGEARLGDRRIFTGIIRDLTARKTLEHQLAQSQKMEAVGRLAGGVAHDFNNILLTILGRSDAMLRRMPARSALRRQVVEIRKAGRRAAALTKQLLAVSRTQVLSPRLVDLNAVLRDTAQMLDRSIGEDIAFRMELEPGLGAVKVDPHQIVQVVLNLTVNARDAMPRGGELVITTRNVDADEADLPGGAGPGVCLSVRDTGTGMAEETLSRMFEPYYTTKGDRGTGLGLSTVYGIVQQSGGVIRVQSAPQRGSTFGVYLPRAEGRPEPVEGTPERTAKPRRSGAHLLLVEDDRAEEAERLCRDAREPIDLVVTDTVMPRMSGPQLVERLRTFQPGLKVIFMSGHTPETVVRHGDVSRGSVFLQKPFDIGDLLDHIHRLVARPEARKKQRRRR
jgi:PAS domain S-box-containing protein